MSEPGIALQTAIFNRLSNYTALTTYIGANKIYDHVPENIEAPYVVIGEDESDEAGAKTYNGWERVVTIHCWDFESEGRKGVKTIMGHIYDALHRSESSITVTGFNLVYFEQRYSTSFREDGIEGEGDHYYHGVQRFRVLLTET